MEEYLEVYFDQFCKKCEYENIDEKLDPCNECLEECANLFSRRPIRYKEKGDLFK